MSQFSSWLEAHPKVVAIVATVIMFECVHVWHHIVSWAEGAAQITASESLGG